MSSGLFLNICSCCDYLRCKAVYLERFLNSLQLHFFLFVSHHRDTKKLTNVMSSDSLPSLLNGESPPPPPPLRACSLSLSLSISQSPCQHVYNIFIYLSFCTPGQTSLFPLRTSNPKSYFFSSHDFIRLVTFSCFSLLDLPGDQLSSVGITDNGLPLVTVTAARTYLYSPSLASW